jgi:hypothetical protein
MPKAGQFKKNAKPNSVRQRAFNSRPEQKRNRAARNKARREAERAGKVKKGDGKVVGHRKRLGAGGSNSTGNHRIETRKQSTREGGRVRRR